MKFSTRFVSATREYSTFEKQIPSPYFRKSFTPGKVSSAEVTICGLGFYELFINGQRITRGLLSSYIANPDDFLYYDNYDLTPYLTDGENVIGVQLGNGMIDCFGGQSGSREGEIQKRAEIRADLRGCLGGRHED